MIKDEQNDDGLPDEDIDLGIIWCGQASIELTWAPCSKGMQENFKYIYLYIIFILYKYTYEG